MFTKNFHSFRNRTGLGIQVIKISFAIATLIYSKQAPDGRQGSNSDRHHASASVASSSTTSAAAPVSPTNIQLHQSARQLINQLIN